MKRAIWSVCRCMRCSALGAARRPEHGPPMSCAWAKGRSLPAAATSSHARRAISKKLGIEIQPREFQDGSMAVPSMVAGELEFAGMTAAASLFNSVAKGAPLVVILDRANNRPGFGYTVINVQPSAVRPGRSVARRFRQAQGQDTSASARSAASTNTTSRRRSLKAGLDPAKDVQWTVNVPQPDLMRMLGQGQVDVTDLAYQFGYSRRTTNGGRSIANGDQIAPNTAIATFAVQQGLPGEEPGRRSSAGPWPICRA